MAAGGGKAKGSKAGAKKKAAATSGGSPAASKEEAAAKECRRLTAELAVAAAKASTQDAAIAALQDELRLMRGEAEREALTAQDVQVAQRREQEVLRQQAGALEGQLEKAHASIAVLTAELTTALNVAAEESSDDGQPSSELQRVLSHARRQESALAAQQAQLQQHRERLAALSTELAGKCDAIASLQVRAAVRCELRSALEEPWLVRITQERLTGPLLLATNCTLLARSGKWLVLLGEGSGAAGTHQLAACLLDLDTFCWAPPVAHPEGLLLQQAVGAGSKVVAFGGHGNAGSVTTFCLPDLRQWVPASAPAAPGGPLPPLRAGAAMAHCTTSGAVLMFGGASPEGQLLSDLWRLDLGSMRWERLDVLASTRAGGEAGKGPQPCQGAAAAVAPDGSRIWVMGGALEGGRLSSQLYWFDLQLHAWNAVEAKGRTVLPRRNHVLGCAGRYVLAAGGVCQHASSGEQQLQDCLVFDPVVGAWDLLDDACWAAAGASPTAGGLGIGSCLFDEGGLLLLQPDATGHMARLTRIALQLPERSERLQKERQQRSAEVSELCIMERETQMAPTTVRLSWAAPTKNADKLLGFKLMVTTEEGRAWEAYQGAASSAEVTGLAPNTAYIFCVKASYDDASWRWSQSVMVRTAPGARGKRP